MKRLSDVQKEEILRLSREGKGYKSISKIMGISVNTVASFVKEQNSFSHCDMCGKRFPKASGNRIKRFCCRACRARYWSIHYKIKHRPSTKKCVCEECGAEFLNFKSVKRRFCSRFCFQKYESRKWGKHDD